MRAFVFPGQGGKVVEPEGQLLSTIRRVVGERVPEQVKVFARAAQDAEESRALDLHPDVVAGHSLGEYGAAYAAGCFDLETGLWLVAQRDRFLAEAAKEVPGGVVSRIRGRAVQLNVSFAAHSPYVAAAGEQMREVLDQVELRKPEVPVVSAVDGSVLETADAVKEALKNQMVAPVRWVKVVETLARLRVEEWIELGGGGVLTRMLKDFELPSLKGVTFEDLRTRLSL